MKIGLAQIKSIKGDVAENIHKHLQFIDRAVELGADLIVFPELSITNYEPEIAKELATTIQDQLFDPFQLVANQKGISIVVGMPTLSATGVCISSLIFNPNLPPQTYSKQLLHEDEFPFFTSGKEQIILELKGHKIGWGICYETLQQEHFASCHQLGADIYIASVAKPQGGVVKANDHFPQMAKQFNTPVLMVNSIGTSDNFISAGQSSVWNSEGKIIARLNNSEEGMIVYDTQLKTIE